MIQAAAFSADRSQNPFETHFLPTLHAEMHWLCFCLAWNTACRILSIAIKVTITDSCHNSIPPPSKECFVSASMNLFVVCQNRSRVLTSKAANAHRLSHYFHMATLYDFPLSVPEIPNPRLIPVVVSVLAYLMFHGSIPPCIQYTLTPAANAHKLISIRHEIDLMPLIVQIDRLLETPAPLRHCCIDRVKYVALSGENRSPRPSLL